jgi:thiol-disulfide isomerase/thioredoxin
MPPAKPKRPTPARKAPSPRRRLPVIPIAVGVVALLAVIAALVSLGGNDNDDSGGRANDLEQTRPVTVAGHPLAPHGEGEDATVGDAAPELEGARFDGTRLRIGADGRPKVLVFLAHWCPHCQREVPVLADWLAENGAPDDVDIYGIATGTTPDRPNFAPSAWLDREQFSPPTLADDNDGSAAQAFGLSAFPFSVAIDADNRVAARGSGELTVAQWEAFLDQARAQR